MLSDMTFLSTSSNPAHSYRHKHEHTRLFTILTLHKNKVYKGGKQWHKRGKKEKTNKKHDGSIVLEKEMF